MVTRKECTKHYGVLGVPTKDTTLDALFRIVERKALAVKDECNINVKHAYEALKNNDLSFYTEAGQSATDVFDLEEGDTDYIDDIYPDLLKNCSRDYIVRTANAAAAKDFLKIHHNTCVRYSACADSYQVLGMLDGGSISDINKVYREVSKKYHPDLCKSVLGGVCDGDKYRDINTAKKYLVDAENKCTNIANLQDFFLVEEAGVLSSTPQNDL